MEYENIQAYDNVLEALKDEGLIRWAETAPDSQQHAYRISRGSEVTHITPLCPDDPVLTDWGIRSVDEKKKPHNAGIPENRHAYETEICFQKGNLNCDYQFGTDVTAVLLSLVAYLQSIKSESTADKETFRHIATALALQLKKAEYIDFVQECINGDGRNSDK